MRIIAYIHSGILLLLAGFLFSGCGGSRRYSANLTSLDKTQTISSRQLVTHFNDVLTRAERLNEVGQVNLAWSLMHDTCRDFVDSYGSQTEIGYIFSNALDDSQRAASPEDGFAVLCVAMKTAVERLQFSPPVLESDLPEGFPPPSPPDIITIKRYEMLRLAVVEAQADNAMFMTLFDHIKANDIPMTAPVYMEMSEAETAEKMQTRAMAFYYPSLRTETLEKADQVRIVDTPPLTVVSVGLQGSYSKSNHKAAADKLQAWLLANSDRWKQAGPVRVLAYNSPFVPWFLKYSEVQIPISPAGR